MGRRSKPSYDKSNGNWYCRPGGVYHYLGKDEADAHRRFARIVSDEITTEVRTVGLAIAKWLTRNGGSWPLYLLGRWAEFAAPVLLYKVDDEHFASYATWLQQRKYAPKSVKHFLTCARRVCKWCVKNDLISHVPDMPRTPMPVRIPKDIDPKQLARTFAKLSGPVKPLLQFVAETGCRPSEGRLLRWEEVDLRRGIAVLTRHKTSASTGKVRTIILTPTAKELVESVPSADVRCGYVFLNRDGKPYTRYGMRSAMVRTKTGVTSPYALRHTRAQSLLDAGWSAEEVAEWLGHGDLSTVQVYIHVKGSRLQELAADLPALMPDSSRASKSLRSAAEPESPAKKKLTTRKSGSARRRTTG
ncbi:MAG: tyrosine-type recombinase/integrase, partial [Proteobacteria bacterium]|nr:tyrosine-type recombinase/integrase [Pseudomonadota bacterium]